MERIEEEAVSPTYFEGKEVVVELRDGGRIRGKVWAVDTVRGFVMMGWGEEFGEKMRWTVVAIPFGAISWIEYREFRKKEE